MFSAKQFQKRYPEFNTGPEIVSYLESWPKTGYWSEYQLKDRPVERIWLLDRNIIKSAPSWIKLPLPWRTNNIPNSSDNLSWDIRLTYRERNILEDYKRQQAAKAWKLECEESDRQWRETNKGLLKLYGGNEWKVTVHLLGDKINTLDPLIKLIITTLAK